MLAQAARACSGDYADRVHLYLASMSPARVAILRAAGIEPVVVPSGVDEDAVVREAEATRGASLSASELVAILAQAKAEAAVEQMKRAEDSREGLVLGGDSAFVVDGHIYGKPHTVAVARERWNEQRGRSGVLYSGHWVIDHRPGGQLRAVGEVAEATVHFASDIDAEELDAYIATGEPLEVAGAFTIDGRAGAFITAIEGHPSTVMGLSLPVVRKLMGRLGVSWHGLWDTGARDSQPL